MPAYSSDTKKYHLERVKSVMVQHPMLAGESIRQNLAKQGLVLDRNYINALVNKIHAERAKRADTWTLNAALTAFEDAMGEVVRVGWEIASDPMADGRDRAAGLREVREAYNLMFEKLFDAGVFERKLGTLDMAIRNTSLPDEKKQAITMVFANWGLLPAPKEDARPAEPTANP